MCGWINFFLIIFWLSLFLFFFNLTNIVVLILYAELIWIILYSYSILTGAIIDDITLLTLSFFVLGLAGVEFSVGFVLIFVLRNFNEKLNMSTESKTKKSYLFKSDNLKSFN